MEATGERSLAPGIVAAGVTAGVSAAVALAAGVLLALITPDNSILGTVGIDAGFLTESFRHAVGTTLPAMVAEPGLLVSGTRRLHPLLLLAVPLGTLIVMTRRQLYRTEGMPTMTRFGWAALTGVPFGVLMLLFALI